MNRYMLCLGTALLCGLTATTARAADKDDKDRAEKDPALFQSGEIFDLEYASDPRMSPDGKRIVYVRSAMDIMKDNRRGNLWLINSDGTDHRPLLSGRQGYSSPRWSPDGKRLAYVSGAEGSPQLYVRWMDTGQTALLTNLVEAPDSITWSPDGRWIAFSMHVKKDKPPLASPPSKPEGAEWAPPVSVVDTVVYRVDGAGYLESGYDHIFVVSAEGGTPRQLTSGDFNHDGPLSWTPDSRHILFAADRNDDWEYEPLESEVFSMSVDSNELTQLTHRKGPDYAPVVSPNGRQIAYVGFDDREQGYQTTYMYLMNADGSEARVLTGGFDRSISNPVWAENGRSIWFEYEDHGTNRLGYVSVDGKVTETDVRLGGTEIGRPYASGSYTVTGNDRIAFTINSTQRPADVAFADGRGRVRQLTHLNDDLLDHKTLGQIRELNWKSSFDGRDIHGWVMTPPNFDTQKRYPLILEIHGGPFASYGPNFSAEDQLYAAAGYIVLYANPRGSTGYGEEFANLIHHAYPGNDYDDLMSGVDALVAEGNIDSGNMFVTGGSGGGVLTAWIVGRTDRFRAAVVAKPVINWTSFALTSDFTNFFNRYWFGAFPWDDIEDYWRRSPLSQAGNVKTPTMLLSGESDFRTPITESEQFYQALKLRKVDTVMVRIPGASHGIAGRPSNLIAKVDNILAWFRRYRTDLPAEGK